MSNRAWLSGRFRLGWILVLVGCLNSLIWAGMRWGYENSKRKVQLTVDYDDTRTLADAYQLPHAELLRRLKARGVRSIGLYDLSLANFRDNGRLTITPREEAERLYPDARWRSYAPAYRFLVTASRENQSLLSGIMPRLVEQAQPSLKPKMVLLHAAQTLPIPVATTLQAPRMSTHATAQASSPAQFGILIPASRELISDAQVGFDPAQLKTARDVGLQVTARMSNSLNLNARRVNTLMTDAAAAGATVVIFSEDEVMGYDTLSKEVSRSMREHGLAFGNIEFTKQRGWPDFAKSTEGLIVRVHSVGGDEAAKVKEELLVDRYVRAAKERNIRVAYIRLVRQFKGEAIEGKPERTALQQNLDFIQKISTELESRQAPAWLRPSLEMGTAEPFGDYPINRIAARLGDAESAKNLRTAEIIRYFALFLSGLGVVGGTLLLLHLFFDLSRRASTYYTFAGVLLVAGLAASPGLGAKLMALEAGIVFSTIAIMWGGLPQLWEAQRRKGEFASSSAADTDRSVGPAFFQGCRILLQTSLLTLIGPLLIIALLNHWKFLSVTDKYLLPKATQMLPLILVGLAFAGEVFPHRVATEGAEAARRRARDLFVKTLRQPFTVRIAVTTALLLFVGSIWIARTGNDSGMEISGVELQFRAILEQLFITRPRTKEIFLGMPALIFAVWFIRQRRWMLAFGAVIIATIGQADLLNSFCHIHTPIFYALLRSIHGVWLGALIGGLALLIYNALELRLGGRMRAVRLAPPPNPDDEEDDAPPTPRPIMRDNGSSISTVFVPSRGEEIKR